MKTLADIRRRMQPGTRLEVVKQTKRPNLVGTIRTVEKSGASVVRYRDHDGKPFRGEWPKASDLRILDEDLFEYDMLAEQTGLLIGTVGLRFLSAAEAQS